MKVAITGHTYGIGFAIAQWLTARGHEVIGFSRANGYDITDDAILDKIVEEVKDLDLFFNNATWEFQQTKLLFKLHASWENQQKTIVNIGAAYTQRWDFSHPITSFHTGKESLDNGSKYLWNKNKWPRVMLVKPPAVATHKAARHAPVNNIVPVDDMADLICTAVFETRCRIQEINFELNP